jgi:hypothetical protein
MAMALVGLNPRSQRGEVFRRTIFDWHPLAGYIVREGAEEIVTKCQSWFANDYDGLSTMRILGRWLLGYVRASRVELLIRLSCHWLSLTRV